jgi:hypothetical protein
MRHVGEYRAIRRDAPCRGMPPQVSSRLPVKVIGWRHFDRMNSSGSFRLQFRIVAEGLRRFRLRR